MMLSRAILRAAGLFVPRSERDAWLSDWQAELWYVLRLRGRRQVLAFCLGAFPDAMSIPRSDLDTAVWLRTPLQCFAWLGLLAAVSVFLFLRRPPAIQGHIFAHLLIAGIAMVILPATAPLRYGQYPRTGRWRRWTFAALKLVLLIPIVHCGTLDLASLMSAGQIQPHATLVGYVLGFRWALLDQQRRCPVCLCRLTNPTRIGEASRTFLDWYGTESSCMRGHGLMHVPEITASYTVQRWLGLDRSWSSLFGRG
jgi:hypothetical protein